MTEQHLKILKTVGAIIVLGSFLFISVAAISRYEDRRCSNILVYIDYDQGVNFLNEEDILYVLNQQYPEALINQKLVEINFSKIEETLNKDAHVKNAEVFSNPLGELVVKVEQEEPVMRIIHSSAVSYYLTSDGQKIPLSTKFTARVLIANGAVERLYNENGNFEGAELMNFHQKIRSDKFLNALIEQVYVTNNGEIELITKLGDHIIQFGKMEIETDRKLDHLKVFYQKGIDQVDWNRYKYVNLKYKNQIVCTKK